MAPDATKATPQTFRQRTRTMALADGTVGYFVRPGRGDDCWAAAVATTLQVPIEDVPDARAHERRGAGDDPEEITRSFVEDFDAWLGARGLHMVTHRQVPARRSRWIGVVPRYLIKVGPSLLPARPGWRFHNHCMVMSRGEVLFDPVKDLRLAALAKLLNKPDLARMTITVRPWAPGDVGWGFSFRESN
jgi:hypothetical protein